MHANTHTNKYVQKNLNGTARVHLQDAIRVLHAWVNWGGIRTEHISAKTDANNRIVIWGRRVEDRRYCRCISPTNWTIVFKGVHHRSRENRRESCIRLCSSSTIPNRDLDHLCYLITRTTKVTETYNVFLVLQHENFNILCQIFWLLRLMMTFQVVNIIQFMNKRLSSRPSQSQLNVIQVNGFIKNHVQPRWRMYVGCGISVAPSRLASAS